MNIDEEQEERTTMYFELCDKHKLLSFKRMLNNEKFDFEHYEDIYEIGKDIYNMTEYDTLLVLHKLLIRYIEEEMRKENIFI